MRKIGEVGLGIFMEVNMKKGRLKLTWVFPILVFVSTAFGAGISKDINSRAYHLSVADRYDQLAKKQEWVIILHQKMMEDNQSMVMHSTTIPVGPSRDLEKITQRIERGMPLNVHNDMKKHCEAVIKDALKLKADYEEFAKWHREQAATAPQ